MGTGILRLLRDNEAMIARRLGAPIEVGRIGVRAPEKERDPVVPRELLTANPMEVVDDPNVDIVVEVMGGIEPADSLVRAALERGKHVVTANKALLSEAGDELLEMAEDRMVDLYFEAAVAGGIPIIRVLREGLASDRIVALRGILNGTSNYVLSRMTDEGIDFDVALRGAQEAGYAEADPALDVGGGDAAHKLGILALLAFGAKVHPKQIATEGIDRVAAVDMQFADRFGYVIKPLAVARMVSDNNLDLRVHPALVSQDSVLASISGALNAVYLEGAMVGPCLLSGLGAGALPTAMSVVSDIVDVGRNLLTKAHARVPSRSFRGESLRDYGIQDIGDHIARYYLRFNGRDRPGVLARVSGVLGEHQVSIEQMVQDGRGGDEGKPVHMVMLTHEARERDVRKALAVIDAMEDIVAQPTRVLRIEEG
ncbi:MAG: homoserine dehydrogenase [Myxococcota bacterium]